jgi:hypothetical protein
LDEQENKKRAAVHLAEMETRRSQSRAKRKKNRWQKKEKQWIKTSRTSADFYTELAQLAEVWDDKSEKEKRVCVSLLIERTVFSAASTQ